MKKENNEKIMFLVRDLVSYICPNCEQGHGRHCDVCPISVDSNMIKEILNDEKE